ncbi:hypothetical protein KX816_00860 [Sphingosinicellaceae bacterium]|nr:hypothetical protein KX816_00860 [Sphingosinicellaceae bacterium]
MIASPDPRELTQGTIFTCAFAEEYSNIPVLGMIITARCDVAQSKASILSYIPVVRLEDWLREDGRRILAQRAEAAALSSMQGAILQAGLASSIMQNIDYDNISAVLHETSGKAAQASAKRFSEARLSLHSARQARLASSSAPEVGVFINENKPLFNRLMKELVTGSIADAHYIDRSEPDEVSSGYVALLREVRFVPAIVADLILSGLDLEAFSRACDLNPRFRDKLAISSMDDYAMPVGMVASPYIEFIMQRITNLFSRIGVTDFPPERLQMLCALVPIENRAAA